MIVFSMLNLQNITTGKNLTQTQKSILKYSIQREIMLSS